VSRLLKVLAPIVLLLPALAGCGDGSKQASSGSGAIERPEDEDAVPVVVAKVERGSIPVELHAIGTGQAFQTVSVESQVAGIVQDVHYRQGQLVRKGDLLVTLDERPFQAALSRAEAALARDKAQAQLGHVQLERNDALALKGLISKDQHDQSLAASTAAEATVRSDEAALEAARIDLSYCSVYAPIRGITGAQLVYPGATVKANDAPVLVVINEVSPIYVAFSVPQQYLDRIRTFMARSRLSVRATPPGGGAPEDGVLTFVDNTVDPTTGTVKLMASFENADQRLWPGQFSDVLLRLDEETNVLIVPPQAVQAGQQGDYVFVVEPDLTVAARQVTVGKTVEDKAQILEGLSLGDTVVTDGQVRLAPGTRVYIAKRP
jgi:multidrug efflux system membrane fusion protein